MQIARYHLQPNAVYKRQQQACLKHDVVDLYWLLSVLPIRFVSVVSFVSLVSLVAVVALCEPLHQREKFLRDLSHSRTGLLSMHYVSLFCQRCRFRVSPVDEV